MADKRTIYVTTDYNIDDIKRLAKKKFVTPVQHKKPQIYVDRCYLADKEYDTVTKKYVKTLRDIGSSENISKIVMKYPDYNYRFMASFFAPAFATPLELSEKHEFERLIKEARKTVNERVQQMAQETYATTDSTDYRDIEFVGINNLVNQLQAKIYRNSFSETILDKTFEKTKEYKQQLQEIQEALGEKKRQDKLELLGNQVTETLKDI